MCFVVLFLLVFFFSFFSLAIVHHVIGASLGERGRFLLESAHHHYTVAQLSVPTFTKFDDVFRLLIATQNNQMSIYYEFGMHPESRACLKILTDLMLALPQYSTNATTNGSSAKNFDHEILLNLMVLSRRDVAAAA